jgi:Niemann-Pick C1 protein
MVSKKPNFPRKSSVILGPTSTYTCCAPDQIANIANQFGLAKMMLGRCPSCYYNFRSLFCAMTCGMNHSQYLNVTETGNSSLYPGRETVESISYLMADDFAERILDSCRFVALKVIFNTHVFSRMQKCFISWWESTFS